MSASVPSFYLWIVFILPYVGALLAVLARRTGKARDAVAVLFPLFSALFDLLLLLPTLQGQALYVQNSFIPQSVPWISGVSLTVGMLSDPYTIVLSNIVAWISFLIVLYSVEYMKGDSGIARYWFFMLFFIGNMQLIILSDNLLSLFIGWEGVGLCSYGLIGHYYKDETKYWVGTPGTKALGEEQAYSPSHAGMKAFVMTRVGDVAMLIGILIVFLYAGTFNYQQLAHSSVWATQLAQVGLLVPVALLIFGGSVGKSAQFPLHEWLPDAMAGPAPVSALIHAATMVKAGVVLVARIAPLFFFALASNPALIQPFFVTVAWIGAFTAFLAATQALVGYELKKILAYSTISQIGYMMMAIGLTGLSTDFAQGLSAGLYHLMSHAIFKACLFLAAGAILHVSETKYINEMGGLRGRLKLTFIAFLIAAASLSGIPPFSGFWSKDAVLTTAWDAGQMGLFAFGAITAGITAFYSFRMLGLVFFGNKSHRLEELEKEGHEIREPSPVMWVPYLALALGTLLIGLLSLPLGLEGWLEWVSNSYLLSLYPGLPGIGRGLASSFNLSSALVTGGFVLLGLVLATLFYVAQKANPTRLVGENGPMHALHTFLVNRWYINAIYYKVFVDAPMAAANWLHSEVELSGLFKVNNLGVYLGLSISSAGNWVDTKVIDGVANGVSSIGQSLSRATRRLQSGVVENYALAFALGILALIVLLLLSSGVHPA